VKPRRAIRRSRTLPGPGKPFLLFAALVAAFALASPGFMTGASAAAQEIDLPTTRAIVPDPEQFDATAPTDDAALEADVRKLARQLRCPTCQALSIADSPSELAREMEGVIRLRLQEGMTPEEVRESFVEAYGEWVLLSPRPAGFNLLIYILPFAVLLLGAVIVILGMRKWLGAPTDPDEGITQA
jgi:cytochrome c-type biogenesis protein CcmH/NrfF